MAIREYVHRWACIDDTGPEVTQKAFIAAVAVYVHQSRGTWTLLTDEHCYGVWDGFLFRSIEGVYVLRNIW